jgi:hypothetical protein
MASTDDSKPLPRKTILNRLKNACIIPAFGQYPKLFLTIRINPALIANYSKIENCTLVQVLEQTVFLIWLVENVAQLRCKNRPQAKYKQRIEAVLLDS